MYQYPRVYIETLSTNSIPKSFLMQLQSLFYQLLPITHSSHVCNLGTAYHVINIFPVQMNVQKPSPFQIGLWNIMFVHPYGSTKQISLCCSSCKCLRRALCVALTDYGRGVVSSAYASLYVCMVNTYRLCIAVYNYITSHFIF